MALWIAAMLVVTDLVTIGLVEFLFAIYALLILAGVTGLPDWLVQLVNVLDSELIWPRVAMFVLLILWQGCAFGSIRRLYDEKLATHGRGSGFWWITPVANLFMPFHCLRKLRWLSRKQRTVPESGIPAGVVVWLIQAVIIFNVIFTVAGNLATIANEAGGENVDETTSAITTSINLASNLGGLALAVLLTVFIMRNLILQIRLHRGWNVPAVAA